MKHLKFLAMGLCAAVFLLAACATVDQIKDDLGNLDLPEISSPANEADELVAGGNCPKAKVVEELSGFSDFDNFSDTSDSNLIALAGILGVKSTCEYGAKSVTVDMRVDFEGFLGPKGKISSGDRPFFSYPFFVAVTEPDGDILAKEVFAAPFAYENGQTYHKHSEDLRQVIPVPNQNRGSKYQILVGFQLSEEQLAYNRAVIKKQKEAQRAAEELAEKQAEQAAKQAAQAARDAAATGARP